MTEDQVREIVRDEVRQMLAGSTTTPARDERAGVEGSAEWIRAGLERVEERLKEMQGSVLGTTSLGTVEF